MIPVKQQGPYEVFSHGVEEPWAIWRDGRPYRQVWTWNEVEKILRGEAQKPAKITHAAKDLSVPWADLNVLAQAASYGDVSVTDLAPSPRTVARVSKTLIKRTRAAQARLRSLAGRGLLVEAGTYGDKYAPSEAGRRALVDAGYSPNAAGEWLKAGARKPSWSW